MKKVNLVISILLGLMLSISGLNKFLMFMPMPEFPEKAAEFMGALQGSGYIMTIVALVELLGGLLILFNKFRALALVVVFPVMLNAVLFHLFFDPAGIGGSLLIILLILYMAWVDRDHYVGLIQIK